METHGQYVHKTVNRVGMELVWRPYLRYPGQVCVCGCDKRIEPNAEPALWGGRDSGHHMEFWIAAHYDDRYGPYVVNGRDQKAHDEWRK